MGILSKIASAIRAGMAKIGDGLVFVGGAFVHVGSGVWNGFNYFWDWSYERVEQVVSLPRKAILGDGAGGGQIIQPPDYSSDVRSAERDLASSIAKRKSGESGHDFTEFNLAPAGSVGAKVYAYALADKTARMMFDLDELPLRVSSWLTSLTDRQLRRLAAAGDKACEAIAGGMELRVLGMSGIPECEAPVQTASQDASQAMRDLLRATLEPGGLSAKESSFDSRPEFG
ncbi:hypothetical protein J0X15_15845 [Roseibium sp. CAU 1637]|uniref:Uncharacterized protein n=1 Tax=Roseibium limicola TaxID=2816037 RepID=A0A939J9S7_9HYPH|nr:hypothetical protein [Roseibium limicola]MBO0346701.1 hypothetical protein [Roseibium limicola]